MVDVFGVGKHTHITPWWKFWEKCPRCKGRKWVESQVVVKEGVLDINMCLRCGYPKTRK